MRFFLVRTKPDDGRLFMSTYEPTKVKKDDGSIHWSFPKDPVQTSLMALQGLGCTHSQIPHPGECSRVQIQSAGMPGTTEAYFKEMMER